jgi:protein ImuA
MNKTGLVSLLQSPHIWRMGDMPRLERTGWPTGFDALDAELPEGGWPKQGLTELLCDRTGIGEVSLLLPALSAITTEQRSIAWINPPFLPYAPALCNGGIDIARVLVVRPDAPADTLWATEQALRSGTLGAVLVWLNQDVDYASLRRLHVAAESGRSTGFLYRNSVFATQPSPAPLRIRLTNEAGPLSLLLVKRRGLMASRRIDLTPSFRANTGSSAESGSHLSAVSH